MKEREAYLGSHDIAAIAGEHPFYSPIQVYMNKLKIGRKTPPNEAMLWGSLLEGPILEHYANVHRYGFFPYKEPVFSTELSYLGATPDAKVEDLPIVVEAKNIRFQKEEWGNEGTDQVPRYVLLQAHTHLLCSGEDRCDIPVLFSGQSYKEYTVNRDKSMDEIIYQIAEEFWTNHVMKEVPPELDHTDSTREFLLSRWPRWEEEKRAATAEEYGLLRDLEKYTLDKKQLDKDIAKVKAILCNMIGSFKTIEYATGKASWFNVKGSTKWKDVAEKLYEVLTQYEKDDEGKRFKALIEACRGKDRRDFRHTFNRDEENDS